MKTTEQNTFKEISKYFGYPLYEAAASLGMSVNEIKSICRNNDLKRWPYHTSKRVGQSPFIVTKKQKKSAAVPKEQSCFKIIQTQPTLLPSFQTLLRSIEERQLLSASNNN